MQHILVALIASSILGCTRHAVQVSGSTQHATHSDISGDVQVILKIDVTACDGLDDEAKLECIIAFLDTFKQLDNLLEQLQVIKPKTEGAQE